MSTHPPSDPDKNVVNFGKHSGKHVTHFLRDRKYTQWLLTQPWFEEKYPYLHSCARDHNPRDWVLRDVESSTESPETVESFVESFPFFRFRSDDDVKEKLDGTDWICFSYYKNLVLSLRDAVLERVHEENPFAIKAPTRWNQKFAETTSLAPGILTEFLEAHDLPKITDIVRDIKRQGGVAYRGGRSLVIGKQNSLEQEKWWHDLLRTAFGDDVHSQYTHVGCIFDFLDISRKIIFECKLSRKDFCQTQYEKYRSVLPNYRILYLYGRDTVVYPECGSTFVLGDPAAENEDEIVERMRDAYLTLGSRTDLSTS